MPAPHVLSDERERVSAIRLPASDEASAGELAALRGRTVFGVEKHFPQNARALIVVTSTALDEGPTVDVDDIAATCSGQHSATRRRNKSGEDRLTSPANDVESANVLFENETDFRGHGFLRRRQTRQQPQLLVVRVTLYHAVH